jgi:glycosyltransferase involved in cell wall biosynthesis
VKTQPLVSVVTIFFNEERFIEEAIQSVLAQTTAHWELLLIDDGSSDSSTNIAQHYARQHPERVRYLQHQHHANRGKSVSRNVGINAARGDFVAFLDGDDVFLPQKLQRQAGILESHPAAAMVYGPTSYWYSWNSAVRGRDHEANLGVEADKLFQPPFLLRLFLRDGGTVPATCGLLVRRQAAIEVGGFDETVHDLFEDQVFLAKISVRFPVFVESGCWDKYRQRSDSSSRLAIQTGRYHRWGPNPAHRSFLSWLENYLRKEQVTDKELWKILNRRLWPYRHPSMFRLRNRVLRRHRRRRVGRKLSSKET